MEPLMHRNQTVTVALSVAMFTVVTTGLGFAQYYSTRVAAPVNVRQVLALGELQVLHDAHKAAPRCDAPATTDQVVQDKARLEPLSEEFSATMSDFQLGASDLQKFADYQSLNVGHLVSRIKTAHAADPQHGEDVASQLFAAAWHSHHGERTVGLAVADEVVNELPGAPAAAAALEYQIRYHFARIGKMDGKLFARMRNFAKSFPNNPRSIRIHRQISQALVSCERHETVAPIATRDDAGTVAAKREDENHLRRPRANLTMRLIVKSRERRIRRTLTPPGSQYSQLIGSPLFVSGANTRGGHFNTADANDKFTVVHFWATWCMSCLQRFPVYVELQDEFRDSPVRFVGVTLDTDANAVNQICAANGANWTQIMSDDPQRTGWQTPIVQRLGLSLVPATFLIGPDGTVLETELKDKASIRRALRHHLGMYSNLANANDGSDVVVAR